MCRLHNEVKLLCVGITVMIYKKIRRNEKRYHIKHRLHFKSICWATEPRKCLKMDTLMLSWFLKNFWYICHLLPPFQIDKEIRFIGEDNNVHQSKIILNWRIRCSYLRKHPMIFCVNISRVEVSFYYESSKWKCKNNKISWELQTKSDALYHSDFLNTIIMICYTSVRNSDYRDEG